MLLEKNVIAEHGIADSDFYAVDKAKVGLFLSLSEYNTPKRQQQHQLLGFALNPCGIFAKKDIAANKLELLPITPLGNIVAAATATGDEKV